VLSFTDGSASCHDQTCKGAPTEAHPAGLRFRRQHPVGPYILDFYCDAAKLAVEVDGEGHVQQAAYDGRRDNWLLAQGIRTLRIRAIEIRDNLDGVLATIAIVAGGP
jgi:very-short-patch-repair endonuclease